MYNLLKLRVPADQIVVVHADLGEVEWHGVVRHILRNTEHELNIVRANKTLLEMVEHRARTRPEVPSWPSPSTRQCTSDLKRGPIYKFIRNYMNDRGLKLGVNCTGLRAEESSSRAKKEPFRLNKTLSKAGRLVYEWLPIFELNTANVFEVIKNSNQSPFWAYRENDRLSCVFCIMGSQNDLAHGARQRPDLFRKYRALERKTGWTMFPKHTLAERIGLIPLEEVA